MTNKNMRYHGLKKSFVKGFTDAYLGHKLTDLEFENMIDWWNSVNSTGPYFITLGDFLRDTYNGEMK